MVKQWALGAALLSIACGPADETDKGATSETGGETASTDEGGSGGATFLRYERIQFVGVHVGDQAAAMDWYADVLGLTQKGGNWFGLENQGAVELFSDGTSAGAPKEPANQSVVAGLQVPNLALAMSELTDRGVIFLGDIGTGDGEQWISFADLEGNQMQIKQVGPDGSQLTFDAIPWAGVFVERFDETMVWYDEVLGLDLVASGGEGARWARFRLDDGSFLELFSGGTAKGWCEVAVRSVDDDRSVGAESRRGDGGASAQRCRRQPGCRKLAGPVLARRTMDSSLGPRGQRDRDQRDHGRLRAR